MDAAGVRDRGFRRSHHARSGPLLNQADLVWGAVVGTGLWYEIRALRNLPRKHPDTLSATTRRTFRTHHPVGSAAFGVFWFWFLGHVLGWWR